MSSKKSDIYVNQLHAHTNSAFASIVTASQVASQFTHNEQNFSISFYPQLIPTAFTRSESNEQRTMKSFRSRSGRVCVCVCGMLLTAHVRCTAVRVVYESENKFKINTKQKFFANGFVSVGAYPLLRYIYQHILRISTACGCLLCPRVSEYVCVCAVESVVFAVYCVCAHYRHT